MEEIVISADYDLSLYKQRKLKIARGDTVSSSVVKNLNITWPELKDRMSLTVRTAETFDEYIKLGETKQGRKRQNAIKDVGYIIGGHMAKGRRKARNIQSRSIVTIDADNVPKDFEKPIELRIGHITCFVYATHKHSSEDPRLRFVFPLSRDVSLDEYEPISRYLADLIDMSWIDSTTHQASRAMHLPSTARDGVFYILDNGGEGWADPDEILGTYDDWRDVSQWPTGPDENKELRLKADKAEDPLAKKGVVGAFCRAFTIHDAIEEFIPDVYESTTDDRYSYTSGSSANGVTTYDDKFLYSHHNTDPCSSILVNAFDMVRIHLFGELDKDVHGNTIKASSKPSYKALWEKIKDHPRVKSELVNDPGNIVSDAEFDEAPLEDESQAARVLTEANEGKTAIVHHINHRVKAREANLEQLFLASLGIAEYPTWRHGLSFTESGKVENTRANLLDIMAFDSVLSGVCAKNEFSGNIVQTRDLPGLALPEGADHCQWTDDSDAAVRIHLSEEYNLSPNKEAYSDAIRTEANRLGFNPVKNYLDRVHKLHPMSVDEARSLLGSMFIRFLGCEDNAYTREVPILVMMGAVTRVKKPGVKFDYMVILEGSQGRRKSSFFAALVPEPLLFSDTLGNISSKEAAENMRGKWIIEVPELAGLQGHSVGKLKEFISKQTDRYRLPYDRHAQDFPRQSILVGTTNDTKYLNDGTGNRRFLPIEVKVPRIDVEALEVERDKLWAAAVTLCEAGKKLYLTGDAEKLANEAQFDRQTESPYQDEIQAFLESPVRLQLAGSIGAFSERTGDPEHDSKLFYPGGFTVTGKDRKEYLVAVSVATLKEKIPDLDAAIKRGGRYIVGNAINRIPGWEYRNIDKKRKKFPQGELTLDGRRTKLSERPVAWLKRTNNIPSSIDTD